MPTFSFFFLVLISHATITFSRSPLMKISEATRWNSTRRQLGKDACRTGNPIDDCWRCDPDWETNRKVLADCAIGFGRNAVGGRDGSLYVVTNSDSDDPVNPVPGTLRYGVIQEEPLWIIFDQDMVINPFVPKSLLHVQVTWRERLTGLEEWKSWNWRSDGDMMINGAFFTPSGQKSPASYMKASSMVARPASYLTSMSPQAGALNCQVGYQC